MVHVVLSSVLFFIRCPAQTIAMLRGVDSSDDRRRRGRPDDACVACNPKFRVRDAHFRLCM